MLIVVLLFSLGFALLGIVLDTFNSFAAWSEFLISLIGSYTDGAIVLNNYFGCTVLRLGAPMGWIQKGLAK